MVDHVPVSMHRDGVGVVLLHFIGLVTRNRILAQQQFERAIAGHPLRGSIFRAVNNACLAKPLNIDGLVRHGSRAAALALLCFAFIAFPSETHT